MKKIFFWSIIGCLAICIGLYLGNYILDLITKEPIHSSGSGMQYVSGQASLNPTFSDQFIVCDLSQRIQENYFDFINQIDIVALETTDEALIGNITQIAIINDTLFVVDAFKAKSIFAYDLSGKFLYKIAKQGRGPGEYQSINTVQFTKNEIIIFDWNTWKLIRYSLNGDLLSERLLKDPEYFAFLDNGQVILVNQQYSKDSPCRLTLTDTTFTNFKTAFPFTNTRDLAEEPPIADGSNMLFYYSLCDTIYEIEQESIRPKYCLSFYKPKEVEHFLDLYKDLDDRAFAKKLERSDLVNYYSLQNLEDYILVEWQRHPQWYHSFVRKTDGESLTLLMGDTQKKMFCGIPCSILGAHQNQLLGYADGSIYDQLPKKHIETLYSHLDKKGIESLEALKDSDNNPVVFIISMKEF